MDRLDKLINEVLSEEKKKRDRCLRIADRKVREKEERKQERLRLRRAALRKLTAEEMITQVYVQ